MEISSPVFEDGGRIPAKYTCDGAGVNPPLEFSGVPESAASLALVVDDPDAPAGTFIHWTVWNIDPSTRRVDEDSVPHGAVQGANSSGTAQYYRPCPPSGTHRYFFKLYALDSPLALLEGAGAGAVTDAVEMHMIETDELHGVYSRG
jgi:Raf kinase inhibitor-like YbhB/YbcL family protein